MSHNRSEAQPSRADFEAFLYHEAALLDNWELDEWFGLFAEGASYLVPASGGTFEDNPATSLFYIADDYPRLRERIVRLKNKQAHAEFPRSIQQHSVTNVRVLNWGEEEVMVECNFIITRSKNQVVDHFFGRSRYRFKYIENQIRIAEKTSLLAMDVLYPGKISILI